MQPGPVVCEVCLKTISQQKEEYRGVLYAEGGGGYRSSRKPPLKETLCNCVACVSKRYRRLTIILCTSDLKSVLWDFLVYGLSRE